MQCLGELLSAQQQPALNQLQVATIEYELAGLNITLRMKQNWWHAHEASGGRSPGQPVPYWEHALVAADYLTRHKDPWSAAGKLAALRPPTPATWQWDQAMVVVFGVDIGLIATSGTLVGANLLALDENMRLLEAANANVRRNVPNSGSMTVALRKALWGSSIDLKGMTGGSFGSADVVVLNHASCETIVLGGMLQSAMSISRPHTLVLAAFQGPVCSELVQMEQILQMENVPKHSLLQEFADQVTLVAMKPKLAADIPQGQ